MARYIQDKLGDDFTPQAPTAQTSADHWALGQLSSASQKLSKFIQQYRFAEAYELLYHTIWDDIADWYIEASKTAPNANVLAYTLQTMLALAHPFAPFVTETIWQTLPWQKGLLATGEWPQKTAYDASKAQQFTQLQQLVSEIRFVTTDLAKGKQRLLFVSDPLIEANLQEITHLARLKGVSQVTEGRGLRLAIAQHEAWLDIDANTLYEHQTKLEQRLASTRQQIARLQARLANDSYVNNAPVEVVNDTRLQLSAQKTIEARLVRELDVNR
jgi:valyl-tRNA synthetase